MSDQQLYGIWYDAFDRWAAISIPDNLRAKYSRFGTGGPGKPLFVSMEDARSIMEHSALRHALSIQPADYNLNDQQRRLAHAEKYL